MLKSWHSTLFAHRFDPVRFEARQKYYDNAQKFLLIHNFSTEIEREVWELHADGKSLREISSKLDKRVSKDGALKIIRNLLAIMRNYE